MDGDVCITDSGSLCGILLFFEKNFGAETGKMAENLQNNPAIKFVCFDGASNLASTYGNIAVFIGFLFTAYFDGKTLGTMGNRGNDPDRWDKDSSSLDWFCTDLYGICMVWRFGSRNGRSGYYLEKEKNGMETVTFHAYLHFEYRRIPNNASNTGKSGENPKVLAGLFNDSGGLA